MSCVVDAVVDAHREWARDEDDEQPRPSTTNADEVDTVAASETSGTNIVADVVEDPASYRFDLWPMEWLHMGQVQIDYRGTNICR